VTAGPARVTPAWLALRERADAEARAADLVERTGRTLAADRDVVVCDLGCGTGSMARWLAPRLSGTQQWLLFDRDADLLAHAAADMPAAGADGGPVSARTRRRDVTRLDTADLAGASLVTASALLDMLTADELDRVVAACVEVGCAALLTISVVGRVDLAPADPLDECLVDAFNAHQRRTVDGRRLLGPDAVGAAAEAFTRLGAEVLVRPSPWRLGADQAALAGEWLSGWVDAACEQRPELTAAAGPYVRWRLAEAAAGRLEVTVHHDDLLALPG
jgi:methyltransferase family protein